MQIKHKKINAQVLSMKLWFMLPRPPHHLDSFFLFCLIAKALACEFSETLQPIFQKITILYVYMIWNSCLRFHCMLL